MFTVHKTLIQLKARPLNSQQLPAHDKQITLVSSRYNTGSNYRISPLNQAVISQAG